MTTSGVALLKRNPWTSGVVLLKRNPWTSGVVLLTRNPWPAETFAVLTVHPTAQASDIIFKAALFAAGVWHVQAEAPLTSTALPSQLVSSDCG